MDNVIISIEAVCSGMNLLDIEISNELTILFSMDLPKFSKSWSMDLAVSFASCFRTSSIIYTTVNSARASVPV